MNLIAVLLLTLWFASIVSDATLGGLAHLLAVAAVMIVLLTEQPARRRPGRRPHLAARPQ